MEPVLIVGTTLFAVGGAMGAAMSGALTVKEGAKIALVLCGQWSLVEEIVEVWHEDRAVFAESVEQITRALVNIFSAVYRCLLLNKTGHTTPCLFVA